MSELMIDPITLEIAWNGLKSIADECFISIMRSAFSTNVKERHDHSTAIADARGRLVAVGGSRPGGAGVTGPWLFTGIQLATPELLDRIPAGVSELARDVLRPAVELGDDAFALVPYAAPRDGLWFDLGTPERLARAKDALEERG